MRPRELRVDDAHLVELLGRLRAVLEHGAHGGVGVDVGVLALHVRVAGLGERDVLERLDKAAVHVAGAAALGAVEDVGLGRLHEAGLDERLLHEVLHALHRGHALDGAAFQLLHHLARDVLGGRAVLHGAARLERALHRLGDLALVEFRRAPVALDDGGDHACCSSLPVFPFASSGYAAVIPRVSTAFKSFFHNMLWLVLALAWTYSTGERERKQGG